MKDVLWHGYTYPHLGSIRRSLGNCRLSYDQCDSMGQQWAWGQMIWG